MKFSYDTIATAATTSSQSKPLMIAGFRVWKTMVKSQTLWSHWVLFIDYWGQDSRSESPECALAWCSDVHVSLSHTHALWNCKISLWKGICGRSWFWSLWNRSGLFSRLTTLEWGHFSVNFKDMTKEEAVALTYFCVSLGPWTIFALTKYLQWCVGG